MDLTPKQQASEAIRQANTILIITGQHPSVDQVASTIALAAILRKYGKKVSAVISDSLPAQVNFLEPTKLDRSMTGLRDFILKVDVRKAELDKLRYEVENDKLNIYITPFRGSFAPSDVTFDYGNYQYDIIITLGVPTRARLDRIFEQNQSVFAELPIINIDFHRSNENYGAVNLIEGNAASLCEILVALAESLQNGIIDEDIATALLTGLMASTDRFTATHTTSKSMTVGAQMMAAGARQQAVVKGLYKDNRSNDARPERTQERRDTTRNETPRAQVAPIVSTVIKEAPLPSFEPVVVFDEPILDPMHIELSSYDGGPVAPASDVIPAESPVMADFAAAAEILNQMAHNEAHIEPEHIHTDHVNQA
ncbi:MAG: DHH family phosphoesterase [Candidatus Saccharibacteria bacterium]